MYKISIPVAAVLSCLLGGCDPGSGLARPHTEQRDNVNCGGCTEPTCAPSLDEDQCPPDADEQSFLASMQEASISDEEFGGVRRSVVVVGGGPVGLLSAIVAIKSGIESVKIYEKRAEYTRTQAVVLKEETTARLTETLGAPYINELQRLGYLESSAHGSVMSIRHLEFALSHYLSELIRSQPHGRQHDFVRGAQISVNAAGELQRDGHPLSADLLVGADGSRSIVLRAAGLQQKPVTTTVYAGIASFANGDGEIVSMESVPGTPAGTTKNKAWPLVSRKAAYANMEFSKARHDGIAGDPSKVVSDIVDRIASVETETFGTLENPADIRQFLEGRAQCSNMDAQVFALAFRTAETGNFRQNGKNRVLIGDAVGTTHFFSGSGLNKGVANVERLENIFDALRDGTDLDAACDNYGLQVVADLEAYYETVMPRVNEHLVEPIEECSADC